MTHSVIVTLKNPSTGKLHRGYRPVTSFCNHSGQHQIPYLVVATEDDIA